MKNELYHYGISGQKWNVRRFQNMDGTYTEEGLYRKRAANGYKGKQSSERKSNLIGLSVGAASLAATLFAFKKGGKDAADAISSGLSFVKKFSGDMHTLKEALSDKTTKDGWQKAESILQISMDANGAGQAGLKYNKAVNGNKQKQDNKQNNVSSSAQNNQSIKTESKPQKKYSIKTIGKEFDSEDRNHSYRMYKIDTSTRKGRKKLNDK